MDTSNTVHTHVLRGT